jgi:hypothetical protein
MLLAATGSSLLVVLAVLACPLMMGLMMLFMGRGMRSGTNNDRHPKRDETGTSLADMKAEQARLAEKIQTLEERQARPHAHADDRAADRVN